MLDLNYIRAKSFKFKKPILEKLFQNKCKVFIFGSTKYAKILIERLGECNVIIEGVIDDYTKSDNFFGLPIIKSSDIPTDAIVISSVIEGRPKTVYNFLTKKEKNYVLDYFDFNFLSSSQFPIPFNEQNKKKILSNKDKLIKVYNLLGDNLSKKLFSQVIDFRLNFNYLDKDFIFSLEKQYFENFIDFEKIETFVDGGGFDGDTSLKAIDFFPNLRKIYFFEPCPSSMKVAKKNLSNFSNIVFFFEFALSSVNSISFLTLDKMNANHLTTSNGLPVVTKKLDSLIDCNIDYLKLDVEGEELNALKGAKNLIKTKKPIIAVCVYHKQEHFWEIPEFILSLSPNYRIYFRHYTEGIYESVMYFV